MSQLSSYENYKQNTTSEEQASFVSTGKVPVFGKLSENDDYTTKSVALDELLHAGYPTISAPIYHMNGNGPDIAVSPDSNGEVFLSGLAGIPSGSVYLGNGGFYKLSVEILFEPTGMYTTGATAPAGIYTPMPCDLTFMWGSSIDLMEINRSKLHMNTTFNVGHYGGFQGYWMHRVVECHSSDPSITTMPLNIAIKCTDPAYVGIDFTMVGKFRWSHMIIEQIEQSMFVGR